MKECLTNGGNKLNGNHPTSDTMLRIKVRLPVLVTHKSTVARTVMCRQDGRGRFPVLLDDLSKCRTNSQKNPNLVRFFYMICTLNDIYKQYNKLHEH